LYKRVVYLLGFQTAFEKLSGVEQIRKQNAVDQKTGAIAYNHRKFSNLSYKSQASLARVVRCLSRNHDFNQFHSADRIEKMKTDHVLRGNSRVGESADRKGRRICGNDRFRAGLHPELTKDFFLYLELFRGSLDDKLHVPQFHRRS